MAVKTGLLTSFTFNSNDIAPDLLSVSIGTPNNMIDVSGLDLVGFQRIIGRRDCQVSVTGRISDTAAKYHATCSPATSTSISASLVIVFGGKTLTLHAICANYDVQIGNGLDAVASSTFQMDTGIAAVWS